MTKPASKTKFIVPAVIIAALFFVGGLSAGRMQPSQSSSDQGLEKISRVYNLLKNKWYYKDQEEDLDTRLVENALMGMTSFSEDPHTMYFNLEQAKKFSQSLSGSNVGIGFSFFSDRDGYPRVTQVYIDSTADKAGLQYGDKIIKIDDIDPTTKSADELVTYIKSREGKNVHLQVLRGEETVDMDVLPGSYDLTVSMNTDGNIGEVVLSSFSESSGRDFANALKRIKDSGAKDLIIDLRNNTGGYVNAALEIASSLLPENTLVFQEKMADGTINEFKTKNQFGQVNFDHIVILQNGKSASASELLIGALKDNLPEGTVFTIGVNTFGKGTEQTAIPFEDGTSLKYTIAEWLTPKGTSINGVGFAPDLEVEDDPVRSASYYSFPEDEVIMRDSVHPNAAALQIFLHYLGYNTDRTDSYFSPASSDALIEFQKDHNLEPTGNADSATFKAVVSETVMKLNEHQKEMDKVYQAALNWIHEHQQESN